MGQGRWGRLVAEVRGIARNFRRNTAGNTLAIMAASLVPLAAFTGSAIDMARLYVVKVRLQQACDAGALAGRRALQDLTPTTDITADPGNARTSANTFFDNNFKAGWFNTTGVSRNYIKVIDPKDTTTANIVQGTASVTVPMAVMSMFGVDSRTLNVTCQAKYDVPDLDIMFVLDTTGSMACLPADSKSVCDSYAASNVQHDLNGWFVTEKDGSRIDALRDAVGNFFDTVTGSAGATTNFRFGFVPYSATVNVGQILSDAGYMYKGQWTYQSRKPNGDLNSGSAVSNKTISAADSATCLALTRSPATGFDPSTGTAATYSANAWNSTSKTCTATSQTVVPKWLYAPVSYDVTQFVASLAGSAIQNPAQVTTASTKWAGCVEERGSSTRGGTMTPSTASPPLDLDVDTVPTSGNPDTQWKPMWNDVEFDRLNDASETPTTNTSTARTPFGRRYSNTWVESVYGQPLAPFYNEIPCPKAASAIDQITLQAGGNKAAAKAKLTTYMAETNSFRPYGVTYHDVGMTWGTRLLVPGLFSAANKPWNDKNELERYIIFMTDGGMETDCSAYSTQGLEKYDKRVTGGSVCGSNDIGSTSSGGSALANWHNARLQAACTIAKKHNIHVFVIGFASKTSITDAEFTPLQNCATTTADAFRATDTDALNKAFAQIANKIGSLRINK